MLAVVPDMEKAVVVRDTDSGSTQRTAVVDTSVAEALALKEWIACKAPGRIARYRITAAGRAALGQLLAQAESGRQIDQAGAGRGPGAVLRRAAARGPAPQAAALRCP